jgi:hypothetical protein
MKSARLSWPDSMPVEDRAADVWEALVMVADAAGGHWPTTARAAAVVLTSEKPQAGLGVQLLRDLRTAFGAKDKLRSEDIIGALTELPESPWRRFHADGSSLDFRDLAGLLRDYDIRPRDVWIDGASAKGYIADDLWDAWERYVHPSICREDREVGEAP